jgi:hypothetical protein
MGFKVNRIYELDFSGTEWAGAIVKMRSPSIATMNAWRDLEEEDVQRILIEHVTEWNLEDDAGPIPREIDEVLARVEPQALALLAREFWRAARGVTAPLDPRTIQQAVSSTGSTGGGASPPMESSELLIPMETS